MSIFPLDAAPSSRRDDHREDSEGLHILYAINRLVLGFSLFLSSHIDVGFDRKHNDRDH